MAATGGMWSDDGKTIGVLNDSGTTIIYAGDLVYVTSGTDGLGGTFASMRTAYAKGDITAKRMADSATGYIKVCGVAVNDIAADGYGTIAMEGIFVHPSAEAIAAGACVQGYEGTANKIATLDVTGSTTVVGPENHKIGRCLIPASAGNKLVMWKMTL